MAFISVFDVLGSQYDRPLQLPTAGAAAISFLAGR